MHKYIFFLLTVCLLSAADKEPACPCSKPWFTGSLIAPVGTVVPRGHFDVRSFLFTNIYTGTYDNDWNIHNKHNFYTFNPQVVGIFGLTSYMDLQITPQFQWNSTHGQNSIHIGDLPLGLDFQAYPANCSWFPGVKLTLLETLPTGNYKKLSPKRYSVDQSGLGTFATHLSILFYKVYLLHDIIFLSTTLYLDYAITTDVHVSGLNAYGGGTGCSGIVSPGNVFTADFAFEYSLDRNWVFAMDTIYTRTGANTFVGTSGLTPSGKVATVGSKSSDLFSFSPSVEYNFSEDFGIIVGCYFSGFGRNTKIFRNGAINFAYAY